jgi:hypothetical protein
VRRKAPHRGQSLTYANGRFFCISLLHPSPVLFMGSPIVVPSATRGNLQYVNLPPLIAAWFRRCAPRSAQLHAGAGRLDASPFGSSWNDPIEVDKCLATEVFHVSLLFHNIPFTSNYKLQTKKFYHYIQPVWNCLRTLEIIQVSA